MGAAMTGVAEMSVVLVPLVEPVVLVVLVVLPAWASCRRASGSLGTS